MSVYIEDIQRSLVELSPEEEESAFSVGDFRDMQVRKALIEVAKVSQKVANMACMIDSDMEVRQLLLAHDSFDCRFNVCVVCDAMN